MAKKYIADNFIKNGGVADEVLTADGNSSNIKTINGNSLLGSGNLIVSSSIMSWNGTYNTWNAGVLNTWKTWGRNTSNLLVSDANASQGTGASLTLSNFIDANFIAVNSKTSLSKVALSVRDPASAASTTFELLIAKADLNVNGSTSRGTETNYQILVQETFIMSSASSSLHKSNFNIASHSLTPATAIFIAYRQVNGTLSPIQGVQLSLEFN